MLFADSKNCGDNFVRLLVGKVPRTGYEGWNQDDKHRQHCKTLGIFRELWPENGAPLPWRLTKAQRLLLHGRLSRVLWPHYIDPLFYGGKSFWTKTGHIWKARRKYRMLFYVLATQLRDQVPKFRKALLLFAWSMRRIMGQTHSYKYATRLGILPGSRAVEKASLYLFSRDLVRSLVLFEGCTPIDHLKPAFHHFVHMGKLTEKYALLDLTWMFDFERYNKHLKSHVRNSKRPNINMANTTTQTDTANYFAVLEDELYELEDQDYHRCYLTMVGLRDAVLSDSELADLRIVGADVEDSLSITVFHIANILGKHFRSNEWGQRRCGSVITGVFSGQSLYARVDRFIKVDGEGDHRPGYASVTWFGAPEYPAYPNPLLVRCLEDDPDRLVDAFGCIVPIEQIEPCQVMVEREEDHVYCWMMRDSGYDTIRDD